ncbi:hypothetical protein BB560_000208 [Smittium megazygosporum]|uniref:Uncharacterized protein n=1 Tax=Smittium megazygosporum TaxID=133381 RepID=A0A2T9ZL02_9FUNG|nr:hypothetical protein BB560_000208 [Smittium megazygosporum]
MIFFMTCNAHFAYVFIFVWLAQITFFVTNRCAKRLSFQPVSNLICHPSLALCYCCAHILNSGLARWQPFVCNETPLFLAAMCFSIHLDFCAFSAAFTLCLLNLRSY